MSESSHRRNQRTQNCCGSSCAQCTRIGSKHTFQPILSLVAAIMILTMVSCAAVTKATAQALSAQRWKITSVKICRSSGGAIYPSIQAIGSYPVYTFFIPRPVWTINGSVVEAKPVYEHGRLTAFELFDAASKLNAGRKNTVKFALPDHTGSIVFLYDHSQIPLGDCYEFF
jgi:hypothetical protein